MPPVPDGAERLPPQSEEAERSVLGSMLRDNAVISDIVQVVRAESFYSDAHQKIFQAIVSLYDKGHPVDVILLADELKQRGQIEDIGNYGYLGELWEAAPTAANAEYYARIVRDRALVRNLIHVSTEILRDAYDGVQPAEELLNTAERKVFEVAQLGVTGQTYTLDQAIEIAFDRIDKRHSGEGVDLSGLPTGYADLDEITAGLQNSEMIIIAARPSVGKTAFALNLSRNIIVEGKQPIFFVSLEQSRIELAERLLCCQARVDSHRLRKGTLSAEDMQKLIEAGGVLSKAQLFIDDTPGQSMLRISANARRLKMRQKIKLVVIDYLQLIEPENRRDPRQEQVAQISRRLKALARELEIPVVALAQVNRSSEDRQDHRPRLADLRESGSIEQDADTVMLLHRPDRYEPGQPQAVHALRESRPRHAVRGVTAALVQYPCLSDALIPTDESEKTSGARPMSPPFPQPFRPEPDGWVPPLENGDRITRPEFERRYDAMPGVRKAELIEGVVFMPSPLRIRCHGRPCRHLSGWLGNYEAATPGVEGGANSTVRLDLDNEPQPDGVLYIDPARGGQARISVDDYLEGAPELVAEISASRASYDLNTKLTIYRRNGVQEYLVWRVLDGEVDWFRLRQGDYERLVPDAAGWLRSEVFPGLWLDVAALLAGDLARVLAVVQQGTASPEHSAFVARLAAPARS
jgi:replicative DNA helicase